MKFICDAENVKKFLSVAITVPDIIIPGPEVNCKHVYLKDGVEVTCFTTLYEISGMTYFINTIPIETVGESLTR